MPIERVAILRKPNFRTPQAALASTRLMTTMLVGVKPIDPLTFGGMAAVFFVIAAVSSWLPARRAAAVDPTTALRES
jgi:putative ABC transport system permease protein